MVTQVLLQTKFFIPRSVPGHLLRSNLVDLIRGGLDQSLITLIAPPGYGKTTLMVQVVAALDCPVLWYQLDEGDNDPATYIAYLVEGLIRTLPQCGDLIQELLSGGSLQSPERALTILLNELSENPGKDWVLVLDDYHFIQNPAIHHMTTILFENRPPGMRFILATRTTPPLPLARWRVRGQLTEIRSEHLRFSTQEAAAWMAANTYDLPEQTVEALVEKTEGWSAGLQLATVLITEGHRTDTDTFVARLSGAHPYIFDYLMDEVFDRQPETLRNFLLHSAVFTQMNAEICQAVLHSDNAQQTLEKLESENLFLVSLDNKREWYRYHHLFREFLLNRFAHQSPDRLRELQQATGTYYKERGEYESAAQHYLQAGEQVHAAQVLKSFASGYLERGRVDVLIRYFNQITPQIMRQHPDLLLIYGRALRHIGQVSAAVVQLENARVTESSFRTANDTCRVLTELAEIARSQGDYHRAQQLASESVQVAQDDDVRPAVRAFALMELAKNTGFLLGMDQGRGLAEEAITEMRKAPTTISAHQQAQLLRSLGQISWWHGDVAAAVSRCQQALRQLGDNQSPLMAHILLTLATPYLYRHDYNGALTYAERALEICQRLQLQEHLPTAYAILGNILTRLGQISQAETCLHQAIDLAAQLGAASYARVMAGGYLAYNLAMQGRIDEAQQIAETVLWPHAGQSIVYEIYVCRSVLADIYLDHKQLDKARQVFEDLISLGEARQYRIPLAMAYFGLAYIQVTEGQRSEGRQAAQRSLELLEPTQAWELFVDQRQRAVVVCAELAHIMPGNDFVNRVRRALDPEYPPRIVLQLNTPTRIRVVTMGSFRVFRGPEELDPKVWVSVKARDLLAYFITFRQEAIPLERALDALWPGDDKGSSTAFHTALYRLRRALRTPEDCAKFILVEIGDYRLDVARFEVDLDLFDNYLKHAQETHQDDSVTWYEHALDLYQGEYMDNLYYDWLLPERRRLNEVYLTALRELGQLHARSGRIDEALALARQVLSIDPFWESVHCDVMRYLHRLGNRQGIIKQYQALNMLLRDELGVDPMHSTTELYRELSDATGRDTD